MEGFFTKKETQSKSRPDGKVQSCASCGLYKDCEFAKMKPYGKFKKGILNIGEAPGAREDRRGKQWQGKTGKLLQQTYAEVGIDLFEDCLNINAVNCRPEDNRTPTKHEIDCCRTVMVAKVIAKYQPSIIVLFGNAALHSFLGNRWPDDLGGISKWRGWEIPDQDFKAWVIPTFHPSYIEREERKEAMTIWKQDLEKVSKKVDFPLLRLPKPTIEYPTDLSVLTKLHGHIHTIAFDYETTGLKPHAPSHRIVCASLHIENGKTYSFMIPKSKKKRKPLLEILTNKSIKKRAHNIKYEDTWTKDRFKMEVENWEWDSMLMAHLLDNRPGITSLKFQTYIHFGVVDYSSEIAPYLRPTHENEKRDGANAINRIDELLAQHDGEKKLLKYCALDSYYEFMLSEVQIKLLDYDFLPF